MMSTAVEMTKKLNITLRFRMRDKSLLMEWTLKDGFALLILR